MKRILNWAMALMLICGSPLLTACSSDDNSAEPPKNPEAEKNRELLATHFKADAAVLTENLDYDAITLSTQATQQLLAMMNKSRYFKNDIKTMLMLLTIQNAAERSNSHGVRVVFDEKGNYKVGSGEGMVFIFPATADGYAKMLYKLSVASSSNWNEIPERMNATLSCLYDEEEVVLNKSVVNIKMNTGYEGMAAMALGAFDYDTRVDYFLPDTSDGACSINIAASRQNDGTLDFGFGYVQNKLNILNMNINFPIPTDYTVNMTTEAIEVATDKVLKCTILDDLFVKGDINGDMQIACGKDGKDILMRLEKEQEGEAERLVPTFALDDSSNYTPLKDIVDADTYESIVNLSNRASTSVGMTSTTYSDLLTMLMQILPMGVTN